MDKGRIIVIEGTDCSGKETQSKLLIKRLNDEGIKTDYMSFPMYDSPTGRIVGLPFLGKSYLAEQMINEVKNETIFRIKEIYGKYNSCAEEVAEKAIEIVADELARGWFKEGAPNVDPKISSLYYIADRGYNMPLINQKLENGINIVLDRYTYSNMAHQGSKILNPDERKKMYDWIYNMEFNMMNLPLSDIRIFLHMPNNYAEILRKNRAEKLDENERDTDYLLRSEKSYVEIASIYNFDTIKCVKKEEMIAKRADIKTPEQINEELYSLVKGKIRKR